MTPVVRAHRWAALVALLLLAACCFVSAAGDSFRLSSEEAERDVAAIAESQVPLMEMPEEVSTDPATTPAAAPAAASSTSSDVPLPASARGSALRPRTFTDFLLRHNRRYRDPELAAKRRAVFEANQREIERLNAIFEQAEKTQPQVSSEAADQAAVDAWVASAVDTVIATRPEPATMRFAQKPKKQSAATKFDGKGPARFGATRFGDLTREEFKKFYLNADVTPVVKKESSAVRQAKKQQTKKEQTKEQSKRAATALEQTPEKATKKKTAKKSKKSSSSKKKKTTKRATGSAVRFAQVGLEQTPKGTTTTTTTKTTGTTSKSTSGSSFVPQINTTGDKQKLYSKAEIEAWRAKAKVAPTVPYTKAKYRLVDAPVDWSALTPMIRSVGACGACWAATTADLYQASWFRAYGRPAPAMSAQHLADCSMGGLPALQAQQRGQGVGATTNAQLTTLGMNAGCLGGSIMNAVRFLRKEVHEYDIYPGFMFTEAEYGSYLPLDKGAQTQVISQLPCADRQSQWFSASAAGRPQPDTTPMPAGRAKAYSGLLEFSYAVFPTRRVWVRAGQQAFNQVMGAPDLALGAPGTPTEKVDREALLAQALNRYGPLSVVIDASPLANYVGGVVTDAIGCSNGADDGQHHLLLVGLASNAQGQYWVLANNWGTDWGDKGYLYLKRGTNLCGITNSVIYFNMHGDATDPIAKVVEEKNVKVRPMMQLPVDPKNTNGGGIWGV